MDSLGQQNLLDLYEECEEKNLRFQGFKPGWENMRVPGQWEGEKDLWKRMGENDLWICNQREII